MDLDPDVLYRALEERDARFDGRIFVGVTSTGIFCRPVCPARTPKRENVRFFPSAEAAAEAGFRPCLVCHPETVIGADHGAVTVRIRYRPPYDWPAMLAHLEARAIDGVERVTRGTYVRTIAYDGEPALVEMRHLPKAASLSATIRARDVRALRPIVDRLRDVFDVAADVGAIGAHLARDPLLAPLVRARPGLRTPGAFDGFELAMRAVLGQQVSVERARRLLGELVRICGTRHPTDAKESWMIFPTASRVAAANLDALGIPRARRAALRAVAEAAVRDPHLFEARGGVDQTVARLREIRGVGEWTAHYIALRAAREPDAFPHTDLVLLRGAELDARSLVARAEHWRPWRAYAAQHLWTNAASS